MKLKIKVKNITTILNLKIIGIVFLLMVMTSMYNHWLSLEKENEQNINYIVTISDFLLQKKPDNLFTTNYNSNLSKDEQAFRLYQSLQPIIADICIPSNLIKYGFYSKDHQAIVAIGPNFDQSLLSDMKQDKFKAAHLDKVPQIVTESHSLLWYGAKAMTYSKPIIENDVIVGHVFASVNQDMVFAAVWKRTMNTFLGSFMMLLLCIVVFRELFTKLKSDLKSFAEAISSNNSVDYSSQVPEFTPMLKYISEQTDKMTQLDRLNIIGEMAAGIAHEIRNPMTTVRGLLQYLGAKKEFQKHNDNFVLMINELDRANNIITEFLSLSKNRAMAFELQDINLIINDLYPLIEATALYSNCQVALNLNTIPKIMLDESSIRQFLLNIIRNAVDAMPKGGTIRISTEQIENKIHLSIQDSGVGIPKEIKEKLGTPFFTTKESGTGLGLAICFRVIQRHMATMTIDSEPQKGTTFTAIFPISE